MMKKIKLDLKPEERMVVEFGPGMEPKRDANVFIDIDPKFIGKLRNPVIWDLNRLPLPFENDSVDKVYVDSVIEHLDVPMADFMKEVWRILKYGGKVEIVLPNTYFVTKRVMFMLGVLHNNFRPQHRKYLNYSFVWHTVKEAGFWVEKEPYRYTPFKNLLLPRIEMTLRKEV